MGNLTKGMYDNVKKLTGLQKDNWNPGDMWLIKSGFKMDKYEKSESVSDINKMFVGSGSLIINQMFKKARENKPCLIFIDEADTIIKKREYF